jgi:hypothetical protein
MASIITNKKLVPGALLTAATAIYYTVSPGTHAFIHKLTITNTSAGVVTFSLYLVPAGGFASAANMVTSAKSLTAGQTYEAYEALNHYLAEGDMIQGFASVAGVLALRASGIEST